MPERIQKHAGFLILKLKELLVLRENYDVSGLFWKIIWETLKFSFPSN